MEVFGLRRTQSLKSLSGVQDRSGVMPGLSRWKRKSVSQLVQHYQSFADLRSYQRDEQKLELSQSCVDGQWGRDNVGPGRNSHLSRSRSMEVIPHRETGGTRAGTRVLRELFESKSSLQQSFNSSPQLNAATERDCPLQDWRCHNTPLRDTAIQRTHVDGGRAVNGLTDCYNRAARHPHDDKHSPAVTKGATPSRQARDRISTSSSVRDRSALYLSRAAATDSTGGSAQPEFITTSSEAKAKKIKFQTPAKEMCSACLTPVYPMEKMVAYKNILHHNCFCCKHCKKKLSLHNYSSLYGEFYCISHYQQLFKRKGNYDEGFGHIQHKDRWLQKNKGTDEPDSTSTVKTTKTRSNSNKPREVPADVIITKSSPREAGHRNVTDVKGKLKMSWPPEKKSTGVNQIKKTHVSTLINKMSDKTATSDLSFSEFRKNDKLNQETRDKGMKENSVKKENTASEPTKEKQISVTHQSTAPTSETNTSSVSKTPDSHPNKVRKSVRFSPHINVALYEQAPVSQPESNQENQSNSHTEHLTHEPIKEHTHSEVYLEIPEQKHHIETNHMPKDQEQDEERSSEDVPQKPNGVMEKKTEGSLDTEDKSQPVPQKPDVNPQNPVSTGESDDHSSLQTADAHVTTEEVIPEKTEKTQDSTNDQENPDNQKKPVVRTNSVKGSAKGKLGSWSKGKSPLSKLFTSTANKTEAKKSDVKSGGLFGRLLQSSSEKVEEVTKSAIKDGGNVEEQREEKEKEIHKEEVSPVDQNVEVTPQSSETRTLESEFTEKSNLPHNDMSKTGDEDTALVQNDKNPSDSQSSEASDLTVRESNMLLSADQPVSTGPEESTSDAISEKNSQEILTNPINDDMFGDSVNLASVDQQPIHINTEESNKPCEAADDGGLDLIHDVSDPSQEQTQDPFGGFGLPDAPGLSSPLGNTALSAEDSSESLIVSQPASAENEVMSNQLIVPDSKPENQDETSDLLGAATQDSDFDIFSSNNDLFTPPAAAEVSNKVGADVFTNQPPAFTDDIFGISDVLSSADVFTSPDVPVSDSLTDLFGSEPSLPAAPSAQVDIFADDIFASEPQLLVVSEASVFTDSVIVSENINTEQKTENSSWMDDLLG